MYRAVKNKNYCVVLGDIREYNIDVRGKLTRKIIFAFSQALAKTIFSENNEKCSLTHYVAQCSTCL